MVENNLTNKQRVDTVLNISANTIRKRNRDWETNETPKFEVKTNKHNLTMKKTKNEARNMRKENNQSDSESVLDIESDSDSIHAPPPKKSKHNEVL